jgi:hypothetical protein
MNYPDYDPSDPGCDSRYGKDLETRPLAKMEVTTEVLEASRASSHKKKITPQPLGGFLGNTSDMAKRR